MFASKAQGNISASLTLYVHALVTMTEGKCLEEIIETKFFSRQATFDLNNEICCLHLFMSST